VYKEEGDYTSKEVRRKQKENCKGGRTLHRKRAESSFHIMIDLRPKDRTIFGKGKLRSRGGKLAQESAE